MIPYALLSPQWLPGQMAVATLSLAVFPIILWLLRFPTDGETQMLRTAGRLLVERRYGALLALARSGGE